MWVAINWTPKKRPQKDNITINSAVGRPVQLADEMSIVAYGLLKGKSVEHSVAFKTL